MWAALASALLGFLAELLRFLAFRGRAEQAESNAQGVEDARQARQQAEGNPKDTTIDEHDPFLRD